MYRQSVCKEASCSLFSTCACSSAQNNICLCDRVFREFVRTAWEDIERFKEQKNKDLHEALISYAIMQISMCKKVFLHVSSISCNFPSMVAIIKC